MLRPVRISEHDNTRIVDSNGDALAYILSADDTELVVQAINDYVPGYMRGTLNTAPRKDTILKTIEQALRYARSMSRLRVLENCSLTGEYTICGTHIGKECPSYSENLRLPFADQCSFGLKSVLLNTNFNDTWRITIEKIEDEKIDLDNEK